MKAWRYECKTARQQLLLGSQMYKAPDDPKSVGRRRILQEEFVVKVWDAFQ